ncbi:UNVERIFIED_CONTAM: hypothetical protein Sradi_6302400 [Sesamum radiatum]|uniref:Late embryogenesis abundant protein LEA-2 subgroup domain-containing protein n=1 Tax=Sesamum radiatum TaxID=300843 RepID=A0AAW2KEM6_SESRA
MRVRTPKVRFGSLTVEMLTLNSTTSLTQPSLSMRLNAQVTVKNTNFGEFKFSESAISIVYRGNVVGSGVIPGSGAGARSTKKLNVTVDVESKKDPFWGRDLNSGRVTVSSHARLEGRVHLFMIVKKKKTGSMNCTMDVDTRTRTVANLNCK